MSSAQITNHRSVPRAPCRDDGDRALLTHRLLTEATKAADEAERRRLHDEVIALNTGLAESIARRYTKSSEDPSDVIQVAYIGLVQAVHRFPPTRGHDFVAFAVPTITGEIKRFFRDQGWTVRPPR